MNRAPVGEVLVGEGLEGLHNRLDLAGHQRARRGSGPTITQLLPTVLAASPAPMASVGLNRPGFVGGSDDMEGSLSWDLRKCSDELRERAMRMVLEVLADPAWAKGAIRRIRRGAGCPPRGSAHLGQEGPGRWWSEAGNHH